MIICSSASLHPACSDRAEQPLGLVDHGHLLPASAVRKASGGQNLPEDLESLDGGVGYRDACRAVPIRCLDVQAIVLAVVASGVEADDGLVNVKSASEIVAHEEYSATEFVGGVVLDLCSAKG